MPEEPGKVLDELEALIPSRPGRNAHFLPDLALKMLAVQVLQYGRAVLSLRDRQLLSWSFPSARAAFETAEDLAYLAFAPSETEYDRLGALAIIGAEMALCRTRGLAQAAGARLGRPRLPEGLTEKQRIGVAADFWEVRRPGASAIVWAAYEDAAAAWEGGTKHWTTLSRRETHKALNGRLSDPALSAVLASWYDILASRSHPGLHSPGLKFEDGELTLFTANEEDSPVPPASVRVAAQLAVYSLQRQFNQWDAEGS
jgi:hypothetical protein